MKAFYFLEFVRSVFRNSDSALVANTPHKVFPDLERYIKSEKTVIVKGRVDAFLGNLIIEFEGNLRQAKMEEATRQLKQYTSILWNNHGRVDYLCLATDGLSFFIFRPKSEATENYTPGSIQLQPVDEFDIRKESARTILKQLERYMLYPALRPVTGEDIARDFGTNSLVLSYSIDVLKRAWNKIKDEITVVHNEWSKYLSIVYGSEVKNEELFLKHTYLATLAKLMVYTYYQSNTLPTSREVINKILKGDVFREWGVENFLIEDFFSWIIKDSVNEEGIEVSRRILDALERYDLTKLNEDIFKELYQELVDPTERHALGEFYTPDWLAEMMVEEVVTNPTARILDPSCGSGTFLAATIRYKLSKLSGKRAGDQIKIISTTVVGIDVHPLAVLISKANYLMALGDMLSKLGGKIFIPIYMADSITFPVPSKSIATYSARENEDVYVYTVDNRTQLILPQAIIDAESVDFVIDIIKDYAIKKSANADFSSKGFQALLQKGYGITNDQFDVILATANALADLIKNKRDSIHPFILKNIYKPSMIGKFDIIIGNPPWLSYKDVRSVDRQRKLKEIIIQKYRLLDSSEEKLLTHMEMATLFFARCSDIFLNEEGKIAFVLPRSVFNSDQHERFRDNTFIPQVGFTLLFDLEKNQRERVSPLFSIESCVVFGQKGAKTKYPINTRLMIGRLPSKNVTLEVIRSRIETGAFKITSHSTQLTVIGKRKTWSYDKQTELKKARSPYMQLFRQGATIVPRSFWFVEVVEHPKFPIDLAEPYVQTSKRAQEMGKTDYKSIVIQNKVEKDYLYSSILGSDLLPFCNLPYRLTVLPVSVSDKSFRIITKETAEMRAHKHMQQWLEQAENNWSKIRGQKAEKMTIYERLDRGKAISNQDPLAKLVVVYNATGRKNLVASLLHSDEFHKVGEGQRSIATQGFICDHKAYMYYPKSSDEAYYLIAILNSNFVFSILLKIKSARGIHKKIWELPIPLYDKDNPLHRAISKLGMICEQKARKLLDEELRHFGSTESLHTGATGKLRKVLREGIKKELDEIDKHVASLLKA